jgi:imidazolonepropionase-like amidohydrolase
MGDPARVYLTNARLVDATGAPPRKGASVLLEAGKIARVGAASDATPEGVSVVDLEGRTLMPGLIDAHVHVTAFDMPSPLKGEARIAPEVKHHFIAAGLREMFRMGVTTLRDVGAFGDDLLHARRAIQLGALTGPRILACGRILSATSPGGAHFADMYREADGADEMRKATREQIRRGADFVKIMTTGARSVALEDPEPAQVTRDEVATVVEEAHRMGFRVAAHCEGLDGTRLAVEEGVDTIEHGLELQRAPELLEQLAESGRILVPTLSCFFDLSETHACRWSPRLVEQAKRQREEAHLTVDAARAAGVRMAMGFDSMPNGQSALELVRMRNAGLSAMEAIQAATAVAADACGLGAEIGSIESGKLADLIVVDGDPLEDPRLLLDRENIWLVVQAGRSVSGAAFERTSI